MCWFSNRHSREGGNPRGRWLYWFPIPTRVENTTEAVFSVCVGIRFIPFADMPMLWSPAASPRSLSSLSSCEPACSTCPSTPNATPHCGSPRCPCSPCACSQPPTYKPCTHRCDSAPLPADAHKASGRSPHCAVPHLIVYPLAAVRLLHYRRPYPHRTPLAPAPRTYICPHLIKRYDLRRALTTPSLPTLPRQLTLQSIRSADFF